jgi:DNA-binding transcriptional ArsR family regulator
MLDQLRRDIQTRLDQLLSEADKLRHALSALASHDGKAEPEPDRGSSPAPRRRARPAAAAPTAAAKSARPRQRTNSAAPQSAQPPSSAPADDGSSAPARTAPGATKAAVLAALAGGSAMTAGEVAAATGLGRASVSTTLSKLAKAGEVTKAARGYQLAGQTPSEPEASATTGNVEQPAT